MQYIIVHPYYTQFENSITHSIYTSKVGRHLRYAGRQTNQSYNAELL